MLTAVNYMEQWFTENKMAYGDHIMVERPLYQHHGIDCGNGTVIEFGTKGNGGIVRRVSLSDFAGDGLMQAVLHPEPKFSRRAVVRRAESRLGRRGWNLVSGNCEHFANWCVTGRWESTQVQQALAAMGCVLLLGILLRQSRTT